MFAGIKKKGGDKRQEKEEDKQSTKVSGEWGSENLETRLKKHKQQHESC